MKSLTCKSCSTYTQTGETEQEVIDKMGDHNKENHQEEFDKSMKMSEEEQAKMKDEAKSRIKDM